MGVAEQGNSALRVNVAAGGQLLDRRSIDLTDRGVPTHPHHHEGSWAMGRYLNSPGARALSLGEAVALVKRVRALAARGAREGLEDLAAAVPVPSAGIAIRVCPELPPTIEGLACALVRPRVRLSRGGEVLGGEDLPVLLQAMGRAIGPPWQARHKLAVAAALGHSG